MISEEQIKNADTDTLYGIIEKCKNEIESRMHAQLADASNSDVYKEKPAEKVCDIPDLVPVNPQYLDENGLLKGRSRLLEEFKVKRGYKSTFNRIMSSIDSLNYMTHHYMIMALGHSKTSIEALDYRIHQNDIRKMYSELDEYLILK